MRRCLVLLTVATAGCPRHPVLRSYPAPTADAILAHLDGIRERVRTLNAKTRSDAWVGGERANVTVLILAKWGGKLRFRAENPNRMPAAELASDGQTYALLDSNHDCGDTGPATPENVGRLVRITLPPDEVVKLLMGSTPVIGHTRRAVAWDDREGQEVLTLESDQAVQRIRLSGTPGRWDVRQSEVKTRDGKRVWRVQHAEFREVDRARLPGKSLFEEARDSVRILWKDQRVNEEIPDERFRLEVPSGLPACGEN